MDQNKNKNKKVTEPGFLSGIETILHEKLPMTVWLVPTGIVLLMVILIVWASVSRVDIITQATGEVVTDERVKTIQPKELGTVKQIFVRNGQAVKKGDLLIQLDTEEVDASYQQTAMELLSLREKQLRLGTISSCLNDQESGSLCVDLFNAPKDLDPEIVEEVYRLFVTQWNHHTEQLELLEKKVEAARKNEQNYAEEMAENQKLIPIYEDHIARLKELKRNNMASQRELDELREKYLTQVQKVNRQRRYQAKAEADLRVAQKELSVYDKDFMQQIETELNDVEKNLNIQSEELSKLKRQKQEKSLFSPIDGMVHNLQVTTIGGVVQPAEGLMDIIPKETKLDVKVQVLNKDIGFVYKGQDVRVKLDTFNFTKYGAIKGKIIRISDAAVLDEQKGLVYEAIIRLDRDSIRVGGKDVKLIPGMTTVADILTGDRRLIEYILAPVMRYKDEVMRER